EPPAPRRPLELRAALLDGVPGWAGACQPTPSA
ncbi:MAG: hypothetical protein JWM98_497, partial [Thermoleophilia bacterium]|nr:hypothetical protein [Thermoleophilia bacterium]